MLGQLTDIFKSRATLATGEVARFPLVKVKLLLGIVDALAGGAHMGVLLAVVALEHVPVKLTLGQEGTGTLVTS